MKPKKIRILGSSAFPKMTIKENTSHYVSMDSPPSKSCHYMGNYGVMNCPRDVPNLCTLGGCRPSNPLVASWTCGPRWQDEDGVYIDIHV